MAIKVPKGNTFLTSFPITNYLQMNASLFLIWSVVMIHSISQSESWWTIIEKKKIYISCSNIFHYFSSWKRAKKGDFEFCCSYYFFNQKTCQTFFSLFVSSVNITKCYFLVNFQVNITLWLLLKILRWIKFTFWNFFLYSHSTRISLEKIKIFLKILNFELIIR